MWVGVGDSFKYVIPWALLTPTAVVYCGATPASVSSLLFQGWPSPLAPTLLLLREVGYSFVGKAVPPGHPGPSLPTQHQGSGHSVAHQEDSNEGLKRLLSKVLA